MKRVGPCKGKAKVGAYWKAGLAASPPLRFELIDVFTGVGSLTIHYRSVGRRIAAEVLELMRIAASCEAGRITEGPHERPSGMKRGVYRRWSARRLRIQTGSSPTLTISRAAMAPFS